MRKLAGGLYSFLPLGLRVLLKIEQIVREEMNRTGALEVLMPVVQPSEIWQKSGRYVTAADVLYKLRDRAKKEWVLGPTHEESHHHDRRRRNQFVSTASAENFYQIGREVPGRDSSALRPDAREGIHHERRLQLRRER
jgi:prolyl-tRNA synthetase